MGQDAFLIRLAAAHGLPVLWVPGGLEASEFGNFFDPDLSQELPVRLGQNTRAGEMSMGDGSRTPPRLSASAVFLMASVGFCAACGTLPGNERVGSQDPNDRQPGALDNGSILAHGSILRFHLCDASASSSDGALPRSTTTAPLRVCGATRLFADVPLCAPEVPSTPSVAMRVGVALAAGSPSSPTALKGAALRGHGRAAACAGDPFGEGLLCNPGHAAVSAQRTVSVSDWAAPQLSDPNARIQGRIADLGIPAVPASMAKDGGELPAFAGLWEPSFDFEVSCLRGSYVPLPANL